MVGGGCMYNVHCTIGLGVPRTLKSPEIRHLFLMPLTPKTIDLKLRKQNYSTLHYRETKLDELESESEIFPYKRKQMLITYPELPHCTLQDGKERSQWLSSLLSRG